jgi:hypothetical protein
MIVAVLSAGCGAMSPSEDDVALSGDEVTTLISGNTFRSAWDARQLTIAFHENGVVIGTLGPAGSDHGTWSVEGDVYCHRWVEYFGATQRCYRWWRRPSDYLLENLDSFRTRNLKGRIEKGIPPGF